MNVKIESRNQHPQGVKILIDGQEVKQCYSAKLSMDINSIVTLELGYYPSNINFEGDACVYTIIDGKKYRLLEEGEK